MKNRGTNSRNQTLTQHRTVALHPSSNIRRDEAESVASGAQQRTWTPSRWWLISEKPIAAPSVHCITAIDSSHPSSDAPLCHTVDRATPWKAGAGRAAVSSVDQNFPHLTLVPSIPRNGESRRYIRDEDDFAAGRISINILRTEIEFFHR